MRYQRYAATPRPRSSLAMRATFGLTYGVLLGYTRDPLGDPASEHSDALMTAALDDAGIRQRPEAAS